MEQIESNRGRPALVGSSCSICNHPDRDEINEAIAKGITLSHIARKHGTDNYRLERLNIERHITRCLRTTAQRIRNESRISQTADVDRHFDLLLDEAYEVYYAAKSVLLLDGVLDLNPRDHEVTIVYSDHNDLSEHGIPKTKSAKLSFLLSCLSDKGFEPIHSYIKSEDARKGLRDALALTEGIIDRKAKTTGAYQQDRRNEMDVLDEAKRLARRLADKYQTTYAHELQKLMDDYEHRFTPNLRGMLLKECLDTSAPLSRPEQAGFLPSPVMGPEAEIIETEREKNSGVYSPEP